MNSTNGTKYALYQGIHIVVHNQSESPHTINSGINIKPGAVTYVGINRQFTNKLKNPYSDCLSELTPPTGNAYSSVLFSYFRQLNISYYDQKFCYKMCYQDKLIKQCGCADIIAPTLNNVDYCATLELISCLKGFSSFFTISDINSLCESACPKQCNTIQYDLTVSSAGFSSLNYIKLLQTSSQYNLQFPQNISDSDLMEFARQSFLKIILNYDNAYYTSIDEIPAMDSTALFAYLGGQLGI